MAKKKSQNKKHKFKYAEPTSVSSSQSTAGTRSEAAAISDESSRPATPGSRPGGGMMSRQAPGRVAARVADTRDFSYVGQDLRRIGVLAGSLLALEIGLWYLFAHTGLGNTVYSFIKF